MIDNSENSLPPASETMMTQTVTQRHLDECSRALGRPLYGFEVKILDEILTVQQKVNRKLTQRGQVTKTHSMDEVVSVFIDRITSKEAQLITDRIMNDPDRTRINDGLKRIADEL